MMGFDEDLGFCGEEFEADERIAKWTSQDQSSHTQLQDGKDSFTIPPVPAPRKSGRVEKESVCIEEKDIDEKECEEVDLERPEKGEIEDEKEYLGEKLESDDLDVELVFEFDGDEEEDGEDMKLTDFRQPPRVPFQTPVKTSPIDILFDSGLNSAGQEAASLFLVQPEVLERKLSLYNVESSLSTKPESAGEEDEENSSGERGIHRQIYRSLYVMRNLVVYRPLLHAFRPCCQHIYVIICEISLDGAIVYLLQNVSPFHFEFLIGFE